MSELRIREITNENELRNSARVVRTAFRTVALDFEFTRARTTPPILLL